MHTCDSNDVATSFWYEGATT